MDGTSGGWRRTGLSKRVLKSRTGRFIMTTAAHSLMRITQHSHRDNDGIPFAASFIPLHGTGRADDSADELHDEPADSETGGTDYWLDQDGGRTAAKPVSGIGTDAGLGLLRGGHLPPAAAGATGGGGMKRRREPGQKPGAGDERNTPRATCPAVGHSWDSRYHRSHTEF